MRVLLDTNIVIHRENIVVTNHSIGQLFYWLDRLHCEKLVHPMSVAELRKYRNPQMQKLYDAKLAAYTQMKSIAPQTDGFKALLADVPKTANDEIDNQLLNEVYCGRVDALITEDRRMRVKAERLGILEKVFSINAFITKATSENPELLNYKALSVRKTFFGTVDLGDPFFETFKNAYAGFEGWFASKCDQEAYICKSDSNRIQGFLYLKVEGKEESYTNITPVFAPKRRLKVGTFKVESTGFRLGERFMKIIFDNAIEQKVDEIYVTLFTDRPELEALFDLLTRWGFYEHGTKTTRDGVEKVLVKALNQYEPRLSVKKNFPNLNKTCRKFYLPIEAKYHTPLLPDSKLQTENEVDFMGQDPQKYALQKVYISFSYKRNMRPGDLLLLYRKGVTPGRKGFESVITTVGVIDEVKYGFSTKEEFLATCENRSVFTRSELESFWTTRKDSLLVIKFIYVKSLNRRLNLIHLWENGYVPQNSGPRPFDVISDEHFEQLLRDSNTEIYM